MSRAVSTRKFIVALLTLPILWVASLAYAQWIEPSGAPPTSGIPGLVWLFPNGAADRNTGNVRLTGGIDTQQGALFTGTGQAVMSSVATAGGASAIVGIQGGGAFAGNFVGLIRLDNDSATGTPAGCIRYNGTTLQYSNDCSAYTDFGSSGSASSNLWSLEGTGPNIYKGISTTPATLGGIVTIGSATPSTAGFPAGTRLGLVGEGTNGARLFIDSATGNPELDLELSATAGDHWAIYADSAGATPTRQLRFWAKESAGASQGRNALALSSDGVMIFPGWGPLAPNVVTGAATNFTVSAGLYSATLNGTANPRSAQTNGWFRYSTSSFTCNNVAGTRVPSGSTTVSVGSDATDHTYSSSTGAVLSPNTSYWFCALASNVNGTASGSVVQFTTPDSSSPTVVTNAATVTGSNSATLNGNFNPNNFPTTAYFRWRTTNPGSASCATTDDDPAWGAQVGVTASNSGSAGVAYTYNLGGLTAGTTYWYCAFAAQVAPLTKKAAGAVVSFITTTVPSATTNAATSVTTISAQLNGVGNGNGSSGALGYFRYSTTSPGTCNDTFGTRTPSSGGSVINSGSNTTYAASTGGGLTAATTYYYCAIVANGAQIGYGAVTSFVTSTPPVPNVSTLDATGISSTAATLNGQANPNGADSTAWFRYSTTSPGTCNDTFGTRLPASGGTAITGASGTTSFTQALTGVLSNTYYYCALASNATGLGIGLVKQVTTIPNPSATTAAATAVGANGATLNGSGNANGYPSNGYFRYCRIGQTGCSVAPTSCNNTFGTATTTTSIGTGAGSFPKVISGLLSSTQYWFCAITQNANPGGLGFGAIMTFTTTFISGT